MQLSLVRLPKCFGQLATLKTQFLSRSAILLQTAESLPSLAAGNAAETIASCAKTSKVFLESFPMVLQEFGFTTLGASARMAGSFSSETSSETTSSQASLDAASDADSEHSLERSTKSVLQKLAVRPQTQGPPTQSCLRQPQATRSAGDPTLPFSTIQPSFSCLMDNNRQSSSSCFLQGIRNGRSRGSDSACLTVASVSQAESRDDISIQHLAAGYSTQPCNPL